DWKWEDLAQWWLQEVASVFPGPTHGPDEGSREVPGMKCQSCSNPATIHLTNIINGHKHVVHLCQGCAAQQQLIKQDVFGDAAGEGLPFGLNLPLILQNWLGQQVGPLNDELSRLTCPACGIKYMEFRAGGRLGCPQDYDVFRGGLLPLLQRIHR